MKLSLIDFLNAVPLQWGFIQGDCGTGFKLLFDVPSQCAERLRRSQAEVGLIPVIEYQRIPGLQILPGLSIASKKEVKSVLFVSRKPIEQVERIAVDTSSRTSVGLLRILLSEFHSRPDVQFHEHAPEPRRMLSRFEAALVIGNTALNIDCSDLIVYDLAHLWWRFTGLPFVFAFWAVRQGIDLGRQVEEFHRSRQRGLSQIDDISSQYGQRLGLEPDEVRSYLTANLDYSLDAENQRGLELYFRLAAKWGLIADPPRPLEFYPSPQGRHAAAAIGASNA